MPFKSEAQRRNFAAKVESGEMSQETFDEWNKDTPSLLPERIGKPSSKTVKPARKVKVR